MDIDFEFEKQNDILRTVKQISKLMREEILNCHEQKNYFVKEKMMIIAKPELINLKALQDEFITIEIGDLRKTTLIHFLV